MTWLDRAGKELSVSEGGSYFAMRFSPDGEKLSSVASGPNGDTGWRNWRAGSACASQPGMVTAPRSGRPTEAGFERKARPGIYQKNSDGTGDEELLLPTETSDPRVWSTSWSRDGRFILFVRGTVVDPMQKLWVLPLAGDRKPRLFVQNA